MNPAVLNYLQSQDEIPQDNVAPQNEGAPFNPFNSGIRNAIESARVSLGMTDKQKDKAFRRSLLTFATQNAAQPREKGFLNNVGSIGRAMGPAIAEHDDYEHAMESENNALANQILQYDAAEQAKVERAEEKQWRRKAEQERLNEQRRYHDMMMDAKMQKLNAVRENMLQPESVDIDGKEYIPISSKKEYGDYLKSKDAFGYVLNDISKIEKAFKNFREKYKDNTFDSMGPNRKYTNKAKDLAGRFFNNEKLLQETADRKTLNSQVMKFMVSAENELRGGGTLGPRLIEMFKEMDIYPSLDSDSPLDFEGKLKDMEEETKHFYNAALLSLKHKAHIDPFELRNMQDKSNAIPKNSSNNLQEVIMVNDKGQKFKIPGDQVNEAIEDGLTLYE